MSGWPQDSVVDALTEEWRVIDALLAELDGDQWLAPSNLPGWTVHDIVSHLIGTESLLSGINPPSINLDVHALPHVHNEIAAFNERWVEGLRRTPHSDLLTRYREITAERTEALRSMTSADWDAETQTPVGLAPMAGSCVFGPSTVGCTNSTSEMQLAFRVRKADCARRLHSAKSPARSVSSSENEERRQREHGSLSNSKGHLPVHFTSRSTREQHSSRSWTVRRPQPSR